MMITPLTTKTQVPLRFDRYKDKWLFAKTGRLPGGLLADIGPVKVVDSYDESALEHALVVLSKENVKDIARPITFDTVGLKARAVGCKTWSSYAANVRFYQLEIDGHIRVNEIAHHGGKFTGAVKLVCESIYTPINWSRQVARCLANVDARVNDNVPTTIFNETRSAWLALTSSDYRAMFSELRLRDGGPCSIEEGIVEANIPGRVFAAPPMKGWSIITGVSLIERNRLDTVEPIVNRLVELSITFGKAQMFAQERTSGYFHWMRALNGRLERSLAYLMERGTILSNCGDITGAEHYLNFRSRPMTEWVVTETDLENIAGAWGVAPVTLALSNKTGRVAYLNEGPL